MDLADVRPLALFDGLSDTQLGDLVARGEEVRFEAGDQLFLEGAPAEWWWVLLAGRVDLVRHIGREETLLGAMDLPGRWAGGFRAWDEHGVYLATGRGAVAGRLLRIPSPALRDWSRTWFPFGEHLIEGLFRTARNFESITRQREALVALGTIAAGLAHELNNPAAAATRAADALGAVCDSLVASLGRLAASPITAEQFVALDALRIEAAANPRVSDPFVVAESEETLSSWLSRRRVARDWVLAAPLAAAGVDVAWCERVADALGDTALEAGLEWVTSTLSANTLVGEVHESTRRISELVAAVRSYSQLDRASLQRTDVADGLESTLVMLRHRTPPGVMVVRDYGADVPAIEAITAELNQVWTNLIDNALDAVGEHGTLRVTTRSDGDGVVVEIGDSGDGMPDEVRMHVFEPFFTTKGVGKGTGLGLDISRRIVVDGHGGEIEVDREAGETVLRVRLPRRATPPAGSAAQAAPTQPDTPVLLDDRPQ
jgi:signal transduction histidine kinase